MTLSDGPALFENVRGDSALLISIPHLGPYIPPHINANMTTVAARLDDTDWHLDRLYDFAASLDASLLMATHSRYVIDLNRPPDGSSLYPGKSTTGLCPVDTFDEERLYLAGTEPDEAEQQRRRECYWQPYHDALRAEIRRLRSRHAQVLLWEAHSIRSCIPRLFEGRLPDFNLGTADGHSAAPKLADELAALVRKDGKYSVVANGRFKGGFITRHYGAPSQGVHAVQLELAQLAYMDETPPYAYDDARARRLAPVIKTIIQHALELIKA